MSGTTVTSDDLWAAWAEQTLDHALRPGARVLIDGRSGSGKSTLAERVVELARERGADLQCVHMEDLYPGWDGLAAGSRAIVTDVLQPLHEHGAARWRAHDWHTGGPGEERSVEAGLPLLVEGTGALTTDSARLATWTVWVDADADVRRRRALARDGDVYRPHWQRWADQEETHIWVHRPHELADLVIDTRHDDDTDDKDAR
jgi:uridine kinase